MIIEWSDEYSLGIKVIDNDHMGLFEAINNLHDRLEHNGSREDIARDLDYFARYVREHFDREEIILTDYQYPELRHHKLQHQNIKKSVYAIRKIYSENPQLINMDKLVAFFAGWLKNHILKEDMAYRPFIGLTPDKTKSDAGDRLQLDAVSRLNKAERVTLEVSVPINTQSVIERCASVLRSGGIDAEDLAKFVDPMFGMTFDEVMKFAGIVLVDDKDDK